VITDATRKQFELLLAPKIMRALRADHRGTVPLRPMQRRAMREMLTKFMPAANLKQALAKISAAAPRRRRKARRGGRKRRMKG
jgi:hypothetical protein